MNNKLDKSGESVDNKDLSDYINHVKSIDVIEVSQKEYNDLQRRSEWLSYLEAAGVDNWEGYDIAYDMAKEDDPEFERP
jgi:hypothetical protein